MITTADPTVLVLQRVVQDLLEGKLRLTQSESGRELTWEDGEWGFTQDLPAAYTTSGMAAIIAMRAINRLHSRIRPAMDALAAQRDMRDGDDARG